MDYPAPDLMPVLSRGKHRNPRKGACFMELASYLAGEAWSDHPRCTHPLLATLAREVNDHVTDSARAELAPMVPEVIGLSGDEPRLDAWIAREAALTALPIASAERQNVSAVALLLCERELARLEDRPDPLRAAGDRGGSGRSGRQSSMDPITHAALDAVPHARDWAYDFVGGTWGASDFSHRSAPAIVHKSVAGIAAACVADPDRVLTGLLRRTIDLCHTWLGTLPAAATPAEWKELYRLTHR
jgi:hypothetical protein